MTVILCCSTSDKSQVYFCSTIRSCVCIVTLRPLQLRLDPVQVCTAPCWSTIPHQAEGTRCVKWLSWRA